VADDLGVDAAKTGMLGSAAAVGAVATGIRRAGIGLVVVDPVLVSKHGDALLAADALDALRSELLPLATVVTPNLAEASALVGWPVEDRPAMVGAAEELLRLGPGAVLLKGGHLGDEDASPDLFCGPQGMQWLDGSRLPGVHTHGTGCVLSAAITTYLALGAPPAVACLQAKEFVTRAIRAGGPRGRSRGIGPVDPGSGG
jgi:hydroxymethylpyrimidine/phosphomethylpyrimidine kinase